MPSMLLDPTREVCNFTLGCADGCPCWAIAEYEVVERGEPPVGACREHANEIREDAEKRRLATVIRTLGRAGSHAD